MNKSEIIYKILTKNLRSAWDKGVREYALELLENIDEIPEKNLHEVLLSGARNWKEYSYGGCTLYFDRDIAYRLCSPSEYKKRKGGDLKPNATENWLDVQTRALYQAEMMIKEVMK